MTLEDQVEELLRSIFPRVTRKRHTALSLHEPNDFLLEGSGHGQYGLRVLVTSEGRKHSEIILKAVRSSLQHHAELESTHS